MSRRDTVGERELPDGSSQDAKEVGSWPGLPENYLGLLRQTLPRLNSTAAWEGAVLSLPYVEQFRKALVAKMRSRSTLESYMRKVLQAAASDWEVDRTGTVHHVVDGDTFPPFPSRPSNVDGQRYGFWPT